MGRRTTMQPNTTWKLIYNSFEGMQRRAVELLHKQLGARVLRDGNIYTLHVLPIEREGAPLVQSNVVVGRYDQSPLIRAHIARQDIPAGGYAVRVMANPEQPGGNLVLITGGSGREVFYGATDFVFDYLPGAAPRNSSLLNSWDTLPGLCPIISTPPLPPSATAASGPGDTPSTTTANTLKTWPACV